MYNMHASVCVCVLGKGLVSAKKRRSLCHGPLDCPGQASGRPDPSRIRMNECFLLLLSVQTLHSATRAVLTACDHELR